MVYSYVSVRFRGVIAMFACKYLCKNITGPIVKFSTSQYHIVSAHNDLLDGPVLNKFVPNRLKSAQIKHGLKLF